MIARHAAATLAPKDRRRAIGGQNPIRREDILRSRSRPAGALQAELRRRLRGNAPGGGVQKSERENGTDEAHRWLGRVTRTTFLRS